MRALARARGEGRGGRLRPHDLYDPVAPAEPCRRVGHRLAVDLEGPVDEVDDPVVGQASPGVETALHVPVEGQARLRHFDHHRRAGGMRIAVVAGAAGHHGHVGLGLGFVVEGDRVLKADDPALTEGRAERIPGETNRSGVRAALGLGDDHLAADQLDRLVLVEHAQLDEPVVLVPGPASGLQRYGHRPKRNGLISARSMSADGYGAQASTIRRMTGRAPAFG